MKKKILFVCVENSNRSQMAQAFAIIHGKGKVDAYSAGSRPSGRINHNAIEAMAELGYDLTTHRSKSLDEIPKGKFDYVITMGCGDQCPWIPASHHEEWDIPDPGGMEMKDFIQVRDLIERKVIELLNERL